MADVHRLHDSNIIILDEFIRIYMNLYELYDMDHSSVDVDDLGGARFSEKFTRFLKGLIEPVLLMLLEILQRCEVITGRNVFKNL